MLKYDVVFNLSLCNRKLVEWLEQRFLNWGTQDIDKLCTSYD